MKKKVTAWKLLDRFRLSAGQKHASRSRPLLTTFAAK
jgi:hypothetical protein